LSDQAYFTEINEEYSSLCSGDTFATATGVESATVTGPSVVPSPSCGQTGGYLTISSSSDLDGISQCTEIKGDLIVTPGTSGLGSIDFPPGLQSVTGTLVFDGQNLASTTSISAPGLSSVGAAQSTGTKGLSDLVNTSGLIIGNFPSLGNFSFPSLATIQSNFVVENNPQVGDIDMPELSNVDGNVDLTGNFNSVELPALKQVEGGVNVQTTSPSFQCPSDIRTATKQSAFTCDGNVTHVNPGQDLQYATTPTKSSAIKANSSKITIHI
jgi:hypothetical protein